MSTKAVARKLNKEVQTAEQYWSWWKVAQSKWKVKLRYDRTLIFWKMRKKIKETQNFVNL